MNSRCDDEYMEIVGRLRSRKCINVRWYDYYNMSWDQSEASSEQVRFFLDNCRSRGILTK